jgi:hypothetical protein
MPDPIEVNYVPDGDDWQVTVSGRGQKRKAKAPGLIAARDRADQLVEQVAPNEEFRTVVHLLDGDALEFTTAYLTARLAKPAEDKPLAEQDEKKPDPEPATKARQKPANSSDQTQAAPTPAPRKDSDDAPTRAGAKHGAGRGD